jgi:hypothetical protein
MTTEEVEGERALGIKHRHEWQSVTTRPGLQSAHDHFRWDVSKSRILSVNGCTVCGELHRESVRECSASRCHAHPICERPYR